MSMEINWSSLTPTIAEKLKEKLNQLLIDLPTPDYLGPITIQSISFGDVPPEVELVEIRDVSHGFRIADHHHRCDDDEEEEQGSRSEECPSNHMTPTEKPNQSHSQLSLQIHSRLTYDGNMQIQFSTSLALNYPSPQFMSLPLKATVVGIGFDAEVILAIEGDRSKLHFSLLEPPPSDPSLDKEPAENSFKRNGLAARILPHLFVETEVGNSNHHVLRNVGKVERFLTEITRTLICEELLYPTFQTFEWG